jgi:hypothetical protein
MKTQSVSQKLDSIFLPIAIDSKSPEDFIFRARIIKSVDPEISNYFTEKFGYSGGKKLSLNQAAENYLNYAMEKSQSRPAKKLDSDHQRFKQMIKAMGMSYKSLAADLGLEYNSLKSMLAPSKELPKWAISMLLVYEKMNQSDLD